METPPLDHICATIFNLRGHTCAFLQVSLLYALTLIVFVLADNQHIRRKHAELHGAEVVHQNRFCC